MRRFTGNPVCGTNLIPEPRFPDYFVQHNGGMIQADGEGFYEGNKVIVALE